ncbi:hypothetical protein PTSG_03305 [Salpingoeca rosetta]|uniref:t-SNARE coiled-coil homology domain-containing protein n=1 Tax=Salpingoeca rosetta (strain ATCC 50818 / BSB-021) TaxID=946362 RepID=F2U4T1_SALR5|nr:uncharacterized protein PTSG_03305 [Salpingoeca rosetta]EGD82647.1 hypothetical protein PTSG_03305 [Salpingoeca rosetta]|eukprot:XP_004995883.1 hypothetical protein PTSG_03305 [Salpingoeca rosetta]
MPSVQDRSNEFFHTVRSVQQQRGMLASAATNLAPVAVEKTRPFAVALKIAKTIEDTNAQIERLKMLTRSGPFSDNPREVEKLTDIIKEDTSKLNRAIADLADHVKRNAGSYSNHRRKHYNAMVLTLQGRLATSSKAFQAILEGRTSALKAKRKRMQKYTGRGISGPTVGMGALMSAVDSAAQPSTNGRTETILDMSDMQMQEFMEAQEDTYVSQRAEAVQTIESTIQELGKIFSQMAEMIQMQGEKLERIDANVEDVSMNVDAAHSELMKYYQSVSSNRGLMLKIFGVLVTFFVLFIVFLA